LYTLFQAAGALRWVHFGAGLSLKAQEPYAIGNR